MYDPQWFDICQNDIATLIKTVKSMIAEIEQGASA